MTRFPACFGYLWPPISPIAALADLHGLPGTYSHWDSTLVGFVLFAPVTWYFNGRYIHSHSRDSVYQWPDIYLTALLTPATQLPSCSRGPPNILKSLSSYFIPFFTYTVYINHFCDAQNLLRLTGIVSHGRYTPIVGVRSEGRADGGGSTSKMHEGRPDSHHHCDRQGTSRFVHDVGKGIFERAVFKVPRSLMWTPNVSTNEYYDHTILGDLIHHY